MISRLARQEIFVLIDGAMAAGARQAAACADLGLNARFLQRWTGLEGAICDDRRPFARASARHFASVAWLIPSSSANWTKDMLFGGSIFERTAAFLFSECAKSSSDPARPKV